MAIVTIRAMTGNTSTVNATGTTGALYVVGPPQTYTVKNFSAQRPGAYLGLFILENVVGVDGNPWYRWDSDMPQDDSLSLLTAYSLTSAP